MKDPSQLHFIGVLSLVLIFFILLTAVFMFPASLNPHTMLYGSIYGTDNRGAYWSFWWQRFAHVHHLDENKVTVLNAPFGITESDFPWKGITRWFCVQFNEKIAYNFLLFSSFVLSGLMMFLLVFYLTSDVRASIVAGIIYAFCPYHVNKVQEHFLLAHIQWLPLVLLSLFRLYKKFTIGGVVLYLVAIGLTLMFDFTYILMTAVMISSFFMFLVYETFRQQKGSWLFKVQVALSQHVRFIAKIIGLSVLGLALNPSFLKAIVKLFSGVRAVASGGVETTVRPLKYLFAQSSRPLDYILPAAQHPVFGSFTKSMFGSFWLGRNSIESTLYLGWVSLVLAFIAIRIHRKNKSLVSSPDRSSIRFFVFLALVGFLFSLPPYINLFFFKMYLPGFFLHKIIPMFRAYARFGVLVALSVSVIAAFGLKNVLMKARSSWMKSIIAAVLASLVFFEFINFPPLRFTDLKKAPEVYAWLKDQQGDIIVAEYPMVIAGAGEAQENYDFLFYQTLHEKRLVNGASMGMKEFEIKKKIAKIDDPLTPGLLQSLGVTYVIFHSSAYKTGEYRQNVDVVGEIPQLKSMPAYRLIQRFGDDEVYEVTG